MTVKIQGTNTTAAPAITGSDDDTGLQFGTDEIQFVTGGTNRATVESDGNLTIEDGNLVIGTDGHGIDFSAGEGADATSSLLDDYEEGTWTPTVSFGTIAVSYARYRKIGNEVTVWAYITTFSNRTQNDDIHISGIPYTAANGQLSIGPAQCRYATYTHTVSYIGSDFDYIRVYGTGANNWAVIEHDQLTSSSAIMIIALTYQAA